MEEFQMSHNRSAVGSTKEDILRVVSEFGCHFGGHRLNSPCVAILAQNVIVERIATSAFRLGRQDHTAVLQEDTRTQRSQMLS